MYKNVLVAAAAALALAACSWGIKLDPAGQKVHTDWYGTVTKHCPQLGKVTVSVTDSVGPIDRDAITVRDELEVMARNQAGQMGGDTITPVGAPVNGKQAWNVFQCAGTGNGQVGQPAPPTNGVQIYPIKS